MRILTTTSAMELCFAEQVPALFISHAGDMIYIQDTENWQSTLAQIHTILWPQFLI